jgi:lysozyme
MTRFIDIVFDGPPGPLSGRFVEVENARGQSISLGEWLLRDDDFWALRIDKEALDAQLKEPRPQTLSDEGRELIRRFEGLSLSPYYDDVGYPTVGYGHLLSKEKWADLIQWPSLSGLTDANDLLKEDVSLFERAVTHLINVPLSQGQFDALVSFTFNLGAEALRTSTLRRVLNQGHYDQIPYELHRWVFSGGVKLRGLKRRREAEVVMGRPWQAP